MVASGSECIDLSLVIACYNEHLVLRESVEQIRAVLDQTSLRYELIFVDDFSKDNTREIILELARDKTNVQVLFHERNYGRGKTVSDGIRLARGRVVGFNDIDLSTGAHYLPELYRQVEAGADVVMAERIQKVNRRTLLRWILSRGYHKLMRSILRIPLRDTETGCKFFKRTTILPVLDECIDPHWFWDTEISFIAFVRGLKIVEMPTVFVRRPETGTTVRVFRDSWSYLVNLARFYPRSRRLWLTRTVQTNERSRRVCSSEAKCSLSEGSLSKAPAVP